MARSAPTTPEVQERTGYALTPQQVRFFETFGFLRLPGLFADEIDEISEAFEAVFADHPQAESAHDLDASGFADAFDKRERIDSYHHLNFGEHRAIIPDFVDRHPRLAQLTADPRVTGVADSLLGSGHEYRGSDGNLLWCNTAWHCDLYDAPLERHHVKLFFYLDPLDGDRGAVRMIPGTNHHDGEFARTLRGDLANWEEIEARLGIAIDEVPSWTLQTEPGDLLVGSFRTIHATLNGIPRRRLFTLNYREA